MIYLDTSVLVALFVPELETEAVRAWLDRHVDRELAASPWVATEFSSALSLKVRTTQIDLEYRARAATAFAKMMAQKIVIIPVTTQHFEDAAHFCEHHETGLRSTDALHLAIAASAGAVLSTLDRGLAAAGKKIGVAIELI